MADIDTSIYKTLANQNPAEDYQKALTDNITRQRSALSLTQAANEATTANQQFQDQQSQRQALQQNVGENGKVNQPAAIAQLAQQNPIAAKNLEKTLNQYGIDGTAQHAERMQDFFAHATPQDYAQRKQELIDNGFPEAKGLPDVLIPTVQQKGLLGSASAAQQVDMIKSQAAAQNQRDLEMIKEGIVPPSHDNPYSIYGSDKTNGSETNPHLIPTNHLPPTAQGLPPGSTIPMSKRDLDAQKMAQQELGTRQAGDDYKIAKNDLLAAQKVSSIFNDPKYSGDLNKVPTTLYPQIEAEVAKISGGGAPTVEQLKSMSPNNIPEKYAKFKQFISGNPQELNQGNILQVYKDYVDELKQKSMNDMSVHFRASQDVGQRAGMSQQSLSSLKQSHDRELNGLANGAPSKSKSPSTSSSAKSHPQAQTALQWAQDPKNAGLDADAILERLGK